LEIESTKIAGVLILHNMVFSDERGLFKEWFRMNELHAMVSTDFDAQQGNISISKKNVVRGLHYSLASKGQSKLVTCANGAIIDYVVDLNPNSPTFKQFLEFELIAENGISIFIPHGMGHGFKSLSDNSIITYILSSNYNPTLELELNIFDPELNILEQSNSYLLSDKDASAPLLQELLGKDLLPKSTIA